MNALPVAGFWRRLAAVTYDLLIVIALLMVAAAIGTLIAELLTSGQNNSDPDRLRHNPFYLAWLLLWWLAYYSLSWRKGGQTVGMKAWRLSLQSELAGPVQLWQVLLRLGISGFLTALLLAVYALLNNLALNAISGWVFTGLLLLQVPALAIQERLSQTSTRVLQKPDKK